MYQLVLNPINGQFEYVAPQSVITAAAQALSATMACTSAQTVNQLVYVSGNIVGGLVEVLTCDPFDMTGSKLPAIGIITSKPSTTICNVVFLGIVTLSGLTPGARYFVGAGGLLTTTPPTGPAIVQVIGSAFSTTTLRINPSNVLTKLLG